MLEYSKNAADYDRIREYIRRGEQEELKAYLEKTLDDMIAGAGAQHHRIRNLMMHMAVRMTDCFRTIYGSMSAFIRIQLGIDSALQGKIRQTCSVAEQDYAQE